MPERPLARHPWLGEGRERELAILNGESASAGGNAWVAGNSRTSQCGTSTETGQTLILHWDGTAWSRGVSPNPWGSAYLYTITQDESYMLPPPPR